MFHFSYLQRTFKELEELILSFKQNQLGAQFILGIFLKLYMFRATMCPSSGETTVFMRHLVLVILCG